MASSGAFESEALECRAESSLMHHRLMVGAALLLIVFVGWATYLDGERAAFILAPLRRGIDALDCRA